MVDARARGQVKAPAVPVALDDVAAQLAVSKGRALVRAEILYCIKLSADIVEGQFRSIQQLDGRAAPLRHILYATDRDSVTLSLGLSNIAGFRVERLHRGESVANQRAQRQL